MRRKVGLFVSYARANLGIADDFLRRLKDHLQPSRKYDYSLWRDSAVLVGEDWDREIRQAALVESNLGLLLISPAFLGSAYITTTELPVLLERPVIPVLLESVSLVRHDMRGLDQKQIYALQAGQARHVRQRRAFTDCNDKDRRRFIEGLFDQIEQRLDKLTEASALGVP
jgi:hypothetical protein